MFKKVFILFTTLFIHTYVYSQLIDNRELASEELRIRPPFEATDRSAVNDKDDRVFIVLDNADNIQIKDIPDADITETVMLGNVRIRFDGSFLKAERLVITVKDSVVINIGAYGNVEFTLSGTKYLVDSLNYQPEIERGVMYNVRSVLGTGLIGGGDKPWFYRAEKVTIQSATRFALDNVIMSTSAVRFDHFAIKASKVWYIQGKVAVAAGLEYMTGQTRFLWVPVFLQLESGGNLHTSFGNERRIGYYFINNIAYDTSFGNFNIGFDFYERQGQYFQLAYAAPQIGIIQKLELEAKLANDIRLVKNGDLYSQWVTPNASLPNDVERISQFAWYYKIDMSLATNNIAFTFNMEDSNDPFFRAKYSSRDRFDSAESINFGELLSPQANSWYGYQGDQESRLDPITRAFNLTSGGFTFTGNWELIQITRVTAENRSNRFLNDFYDYEIRTATFPNISYGFDTFDLVKYDYKTQSKLTVLTSDGKSNTINISRLPQYETMISKRSNRSIQRRVVQENGITRTNMVTNWTPVTITSLITNEYSWFETSLSVTGDFKFSAQKTYGTNDSSRVQDVNQLTTNWQVIGDLNQHEENGQIDFKNMLFDGMWTIDNSVKINYKEVWSSFAEDFTNSLLDSGLRMSYVIGTTFNPKKVWNDDELYRSSLELKSAINYEHPLFYLLRLQNELVPEGVFTWENTASWEFLQWQRQTILGASLTANWNLRDRVPTSEQQQTIDNSTTNIYFSNRIFDRLTLAAKGQVFWFSIGTEATVDLLDTRTNLMNNSFIPVTGSSFTNRLVGGFPKLLLEFTPDEKYHYIPKLLYRYNLFEESRTVIVTNRNGDIFPTELRADKSFNLEFLWDVKLRNYQIPALYPFIYEISEFGFTLQYFQDFINIRNSYLRFDFVIGIKFTKYLTFKFTSQMLNREIHLYFPEIYNGESILAPNEVSKDFFTDLLDGLTIWNQDALRRSSFKLQSLNFELIHDLDTWDMRIIFNLGRRVDEVKQVAFWEPYIGVAFTMKGSSAADIFPEFQRRLVPAEYQ